MLYIKKESILSISIWAIILIQINLFYIYTVDWKTQIEGLIFWAAYLAIIYRDKEYIWNVIGDSYINNYAIIVILSVALQILVSTFRYSQSIVDLIKNPISYLSVFGIVVYYMFFYYKNGIEYFFDHLLYIIIIFELLLIAQAVLYNNGFNIIFLDSLFSDGTLKQVRNGLLRSGMLPRYVFICVYYSFYQLISKKSNKRILHLACVILGIICEFYIAQVRASMYVYIIGLYIMYVIYKYICNEPQKMLLIIICGVLILLFTGVIDVVLNSIFNAEADTITGRSEAVSYYWQYLKKNPVLGMGYIYPSTSELSHLLYGPDLYHKYNFSDVGLFGYFAELGMFAIPMFIWPFVRMIRIAINMLREHCEIGSFLFSVIFYLCISSITLRIPMVELCFFIALFEFCNTYTRRNIYDTNY